MGYNQYTVPVPHTVAVEPTFANNKTFEGICLTPGKFRQRGVMNYLCI